MSTASPFVRYAAALDAELRAVVPSEPAGLYGMIRYHLGWADAAYRPSLGEMGKRLRPTLCLLCCEAVGGDYERAVPAAAAVELLHNFSLVHDDIQDQSAERRHRRTVWSIWGAPQGINAGDALFVLAHQALYRLRDRGLAPSLVLAAAEALAGAALALCGGQYRDMEFEVRPIVSTAEYLAMVRGKTAALLGCSAFLGALIGSGDQAIAEAHRLFGERLGVAFQIEDDILGIWGDPLVTGKPAADDVRSRKKTLPVVQALETLHGPDREFLGALYAQPALAEDQVAAVIALLDQHDARRQTAALAHQWYERALTALEAACPACGYEEQLRALAASLVGRTF